MDISEVVRRWQAGGSRRRIAAGTDCPGKPSGSTSRWPRGWEYPGRDLGPPRSSSAVWRQSAAPGRSTGLSPPRTDWLPGPTRSTSGSPAAAFNSPEFRSCWRSGVAQCTGDTGPRLMCAPQRPPPIGCRAMPAQARGLLKCQHSYGGRGEKFAGGQPDKWTPSAKQPRRLSSG